MRRRALLAASLMTYSPDIPDEPDIDINLYMTIEALEDGVSAALSQNNIEYCINGDGNWVLLTAGTYTPSITAGETLSFRGYLNPAMVNGIGTFTINKRCNLKGNCNSLLFGDNAASNNSLGGADYTFINLFRNCTTIKSVSANFLPATTLANYCYYSMFYDCTSLVTAPELPATTLASSCYYSMFQHCKSLIYIKMLATNISATSCLNSWVWGVNSSGTFVKNAEATWDVRGSSGIPIGWTVITE